MDANSKASRRHAYQGLALLALPLLIAMGVEISKVPKDPTHVGSLRLHADFEILQYAFAAVLAAAGGTFGWIAVATAAIFKLISFTGDVSGFQVIHRGSLGEAAALLSVAHIFRDGSRLTKLMAKGSRAIAYALLLIALCTVWFEMKPGLGLGISTWPYIFLLLATFYYGLSPQRLLPAAVIVCVLGLAASYVRGFVDLGNILGYFWFPVPLAKLLNIGSPDPGYNFYHFVELSFSLPSPVATFVVVYIGLLGRGLRQHWLSEEPHLSLERTARRLTSRTGLVAFASLATLIWGLTLSVVYGWQVHLPEDDVIFREAVSLINQTAFLAVPFAAFCLGAVYGGRGVLLAVMCYVILVAALHLGIGMTEVGTFMGKTIIADAVKTSYWFQGINLGRGLALPVYALLGMIVSERRGFERPAAGGAAH